MIHLVYQPTIIIVQLLKLASNRLIWHKVKTSVLSKEMKFQSSIASPHFIIKFISLGIYEVIKIYNGCVHANMHTVLALGAHLDISKRVHHGHKDYIIIYYFQFQLTLHSSTKNMFLLEHRWDETLYTCIVIVQKTDRDKNKSKLHFDIIMFRNQGLCP